VKDIHGPLEVAIDRYEDVANIVEMIVVSTNRCTPPPGDV